MWLLYLWYKVCMHMLNPEWWAFKTVKLFWYLAAQKIASVSYWDPRKLWLSQYLMLWYSIQFCRIWQIKQHNYSIWNILYTTNYWCTVEITLQTNDINFMLMLLSKSSTRKDIYKSQQRLFQGRNTWNQFLQLKQHVNREVYQGEYIYSLIGHYYIIL